MSPFHKFILMTKHFSVTHLLTWIHDTAY